jgi:hypothetical protein
MQESRQAEVKSRNNGADSCYVRTHARTHARSLRKSTVRIRCTAVCSLEDFTETISHEALYVEDGSSNCQR